jgi:glucose-specific phosphotransferase system IIA component
MKGISFMSINTYQLKAFLSGKVIPIEAVKDPVFSTRMLGNGLAIEPTDNVILAPCDGIISMTIPRTKHAVGITAANGMDLLIHLGLGTVHLKGEGFQLFVQKGDLVKAGDKLIQFDAEVIKTNGYPLTCVLAVVNSDCYPNMKLHTEIEAIASKTVIAEI